MNILRYIGKGIGCVFALINKDYYEFILEYQWYIKKDSLNGNYLRLNRIWTTNLYYICSTLPLVQFAIDLGCSKSRILFTAASYGFIEVLPDIWHSFNPSSHEYYEEFRDACAHGACKGGEIPVLEWMLATNLLDSHDGQLCNIAASEGHAHLLNWLRRQNPPFEWSCMTMLAAIDAKDFELVLWLRISFNPPCPWDSRVSYVVARNGNVFALYSLRKVFNPPCPWSKQECQELIDEAYEEGRIVTEHDSIEGLQYYYDALFDDDVSDNDSDDIPALVSVL